VSAVHFGGAPNDRQRFRNQRAELFWLLREALEKEELGLPDDEELIADLSALRYSFDQAGRIVLEFKDEVRKRLGRSPDRGDAVALAVGPGRAKRGTFRMRKVSVGAGRVLVRPYRPNPLGDEVPAGDRLTWGTRSGKGVRDACCEARPWPYLRLAPETGSPIPTFVRRYFGL